LISDPKVANGNDHASVLERLEFQMICERGKYLLGRGHNSAGETILGHFGQLPLSDVQVYLSDKCFSYISPYRTAAEQANIKQEEEWFQRDFLVWSKDETREYFLAGGGAKNEFNRRWAAAMQGKRNELESIGSRTAFKAGGGLTYLFSARKV
jgi:hypothetical protein